jgi:hypothetical protein
MVPSLASLHSLLGIPAERPLVQSQSWWADLQLVLYATGVQSVGVVALMALLLGGGFVLAAGLLPGIGSTLSLQLMTLLVTQSLGVLSIILIFLIRSITPLSLAVHHLRRGASPWLRCRPQVIVLGGAISACVLYLQSVAITLLAAICVSDYRLDLLEFQVVAQALNPVVVLSGVIRVGLFSALSMVAVIERWPPLQSRPSESSMAVASDLFRLLVLLLALELVFEILPFSAPLS